MGRLAIYEHLFQSMTESSYQFKRHSSGRLDKNHGFYEHARSEHARQWEPFHVRACVSFCSWGPLGTVRHCQHRVLRPLISNLRSDTTSEVIWRPPWPQRPTNWWLEAIYT